MRQSGYCSHACRTATWARWRRDNERDGRDGEDPTLTKELSAEGRAICGCNMVAEMTGHGSGAWMLGARRSGWRSCRTEAGLGTGRSRMGKETEKRSEVWAKGTYMRIRRERRASERTAWQGDWPRRGFREVLHWRVGVTDCLGEAGRRGRDCGRGRLGGLGWRETRCGTLGCWAHLLGRRQDGRQHEPKVLVLRAREAAVAMDRWIDGSMDRWRGSSDGQDGQDGQEPRRGREVEGAINRYGGQHAGEAFAFVSFC